MAAARLARSVGSSRRSPEDVERVASVQGTIPGESWGKSQIATPMNKTASAFIGQARAKPSSMGCVGHEHYGAEHDCGDDKRERA